MEGSKPCGRYSPQILSNVQNFFELKKSKYLSILMHDPRKINKY
jgi:hypothetical protein